MSIEHLNWVNGFSWWSFSVQNSIFLARSFNSLLHNSSAGDTDDLSQNKSNYPASSHLYPHISTLTSLPSHLYPRISILTSLPSHLYPHISTLASLPSHLYPCISTLTSLPSHLYPHISTLTSLPTHPHPDIERNLKETQRHDSLMTQWRVLSCISKWDWHLWDLRCQLRVCISHLVSLH